MAEQQPEMGIREQLLVRAMQDPAFAEQLRTNPREAVRSALGVELPGNIEIRVVEDTPNVVHIVLPTGVGGAARGELSDADLGAVAGGGSWSTCNFPCGTQGACPTGAPNALTCTIAC